MSKHLEGLGPKKKEKLEKYLERKMGNVVEYYFGLMKKKRAIKAVEEEIPTIAF